MIAAALCTILAATAKDLQNGTGETDGYKLVWQDLFDGDELDNAAWNIEVNGNGGGNAELQYYSARPENVRVGDDGNGNGCLILTAVREEYENKHFTSGRVNTLGKLAFKHGKIEASIKLPTTANGLCPSFGMTGNDYNQVGRPVCGETDIMEFGHQEGIKAGTSDRYFSGSSHWGAAWDKTSDLRNAVTWDYSLQDGEFHLWTAIWDEARISMYCDLDKFPHRAPYYTLDISEVNPADDLCAGNYFHKDNFILLALAVGGHTPGIYNAAGITALNDENSGQASMYVNYIKVYQKDDNSGNITLPPGSDPEPDPEPDPDPEPTDWTGTDIWPDAEPTLTYTYYNPDPKWDAESNDATCTIADSKLTFDIPRQTYAHWQAQFFIETGLPMKAEHKYGISFNLTSTTTGSGQVKLMQSGDNDYFHFCDVINFEAAETKAFKWEELSGKDFTSTTIVFDFGLVPDNTHIEITDITFTEYRPKYSDIDDIDIGIDTPLAISLQGSEIVTNKEAAITVYDLSGRTAASTPAATDRLNVAKIPSGIYVIKAVSSNSSAKIKARIHR